MARPIEQMPLGTGATLREELERLSRHYDGVPVDVSWEGDREVPAGLERLAQSVLAEALRNAHKHARASKVQVKVAGDGSLFVLEVKNDGVGQVQAGHGAGMGLRLAALDALQRGGVVEFGPAESSHWRVRLVVPVPEAEG
jgi:signal transduction histidine kinase